MRFWFTLGLIILVGVLAFRSCSDKFGSPPKVVKPAASKEPAKKEKEVPPPPAAPGVPAKHVPVTPATAAPAAFSAPAFSALSQAAPATVFMVYTFQQRLVPPATVFTSLAASSPGGTGVSSPAVASVTIDEATNSVFIRGPIESVNSMRDACRSLDIASDEAFCDAWMLFVRGDKVKDFEAAIGWSEDGTDFSGSASISPDGFGVAVPAGPLKLSLSMLSSRGLLEVIDRPQLRLSSGHKSEVSTGDEVPFPVTSFRNGLNSTSIEFKRVGLSFEVTPLFLSGNRVRMDVRAENGLLGATQKIGDIEVPSISRQTVTSAATLSMDDALVIGGLESVRRERRFGMFGESEKMQVGRLYVCIMLRSGYPRAVPVIGPGPDLGIEIPGVLGDPGQFGEGVLPPKGWLDREIDRVEKIIRRKSGPPGK